MNKKTLLSAAASLALLASPLAGIGKADAASNTNCPQATKVQTYQYQTNNVQDANAWLQNILSKYNVDYKVQLPQQAQQAQAQQTQQAPKQVQQPQTQKAEAPAQQQTQTQQKAADTSKDTSAQNGALSAYEQQVVDLTNKERTQRGLSPLKVDTALSKMARDKSADMQKNNYFDHQSPTYGSPFDMMKKYGISYQSAGENIAMGQQTPQEVVNAWMNSQGHRENILNPNYTHIGVGYVENGHYWTQEFIGK
ncbi:CAP domain-containing protein [Falsibacillus pallidus]|uniref:Putative YkwD family protein n=1 Tax=Falsibacillus pallidus TaxID=493781 RepID=A0A370GMI2_9BACI|nr:CAP domain-containing protein [Falsibacillus pallidus]RDI43113.1 putative YkwD family protein [Falsibacillus pallidus]